MPFLGGSPPPPNDAELFEVRDSLNDTLADALSSGYKYVKSLKRGSEPDNNSRKALAEAAATLLQLATDPKEYLDQLAGNNQVLICIRWLVRFDVLQHIPLQGGIAYSALSSAAQVPESQLKSVVRMAITNGFLSEPEPGAVSHSRFSWLISEDQSFMDWARFLTDYSVPSAYKFPEATEKWGSTEAKDQTAFSLAMGKHMPFFDYLREHQGMAKVFSSYMRNVASTDGIKFDHLLAGFDWGRFAHGATIADVGGSRGHASMALAKQFPNLNFIVQDLPETIAGAEESVRSEDTTLSSRIKFMQHDFFKPQPVVDADVYLLRMIIHDWPDSEALKILTHLRDALKKPDARIVIMDTVLPQPGSISALEERKLRVRDLTMIQVFNAKEREYEGWSELLSKAGLRIINSQHPPGSVMSLLEVGLRNDMPTEIDSIANGFPVHVNGYNNKKSSGVDHAGVPFPSGASDIVAASTKGVNGQTSHDAKTSSRPVIIIGAGIGGLGLAQSLQKSGVDFKLFERDPVLDHRPQGYRLKIEADGAAALKSSLPDDVFELFEKSAATTTIGQTDFNPINGLITKSREGSGLAGSLGLSASATVDRGVFRRILTTGISDKIVFGKELASYETIDADGTVNVAFKDGSHVEGCFLVGADGVRSAVRKVMVPENKYVDTGAMCIYGKTPMSAELVEQFPAKGLRWMTCCIDEAPSIQSILIGDSPLTCLAEPIRFPAKNRAHVDLPDDYVYWVLIGRKELFAATPEDAARMSSAGFGARESAKLSLELTKEWHDSIGSLIRLQDTRQSSTMRVVSALPKIAAWKASRFGTLIGDAIHAMSPCGGVGANTALTDAAELAKIVIEAHRKGGSITEESVGSFEEAMRVRAFKSVMRSFAGSKKMFDQRPFDECSVVRV